MSIKRTESSISRDRQLPFWDSSDPSRNPPPMPMNPDSPLNTTPTRQQSPVRSFHSRNLSALANGDERVSDILDIAKLLKTQTQNVEDSVREALIEFGGLAHRSRDNGVALGYLKEHVKKTEDVATSTESAVTDNLMAVKSSLDTQKESQRALTTVTDALLESTRDINRQLQRHDVHFKSLLKQTEVNGSSSGHKDATRIVQEITSELEYRNNTMMEVVQSMRDAIPDNDYVLDMLRQRLDRTASDQSKSLAHISDSVADLNQKLENRDGPGDNENSKLISSIHETSLLVETLTQRVDRTASDNTKSIRQLSDEVALLQTKFTSNSRKDSGRGQSDDAKYAEILTKLESSSRSVDHGDKLAELMSKIDQLKENNDGSKHQSDELLAKIERGIDQDQFDELMAKVEGLNTQAQLTDLLAKVEALSTAENTNKQQDTTTSTTSSASIEQSQYDEIIKRIDLVKVDPTEMLEKLAINIEGIATQQTKTIDQLSTREGTTNLESLMSKLDDMSKQSKEDISSFFDTVSQKLEDHGDKSVKTLETVQADIRSLIDFQYGDMTSFSDQIQTIVTRLDKLSDTTAAEEKATELEKQLEETKSAKDKEIEELKEQVKALSKRSPESEQEDGDKVEKKIDLESQVVALEQQKSNLREDISGMKAELKIRYEEFTHLEDRIGKFEERLNHAILDRSKGILGSTTMTIINNTPKGQSSASSPPKQPLGKSSGSKRNLSFAPDELNEDLEDSFPIGKENELAVAKRGSPFSNSQKGRSISLFVDH